MWDSAARVQWIEESGRNLGPLNWARQDVVWGAWLLGFEGPSGGGCAGFGVGGTRCGAMGYFRAARAYCSRSFGRR